MQYQKQANLLWYEMELLAKEVQSKTCDILSYELMTYPFEEGCTFHFTRCPVHAGGRGSRA